MILRHTFLLHFFRNFGLMPEFFKLFVSHLMSQNGVISKLLLRFMCSTHATYIRHEFLTLIVSMARFFVKIIISKVADSRFLITFSNVYFWQAAFKNETAVSEYQRKKYSQFNTLMGVSLQNF